MVVSRVTSVLWYGVITVLLSAYMTATSGPHGGGVEALHIHRSPYKAKLVGGKAAYNVFGDFLNYYIFAEAGAVVTPAPQWEVFLGNTKQTMFANTTSMTFYTLSHPIGATPVRGTKHVVPNVNSRLVLSDWVFPYPGHYNMLFNVTSNGVVPGGPYLTFNISVTVDPQPGKIILVQAPSGYNGSALTVEPQAQLQDFLGNPARVATPIVTFTILSGPVNYTTRGTLSTYPTSTGLVKLSDVILSLPGKYIVVLRAALTDNTTIQTPSFSLTIQRALPTAIVVITPPSGVTRAVFLTTPTYRIIDSVGFSIDPRVNITVSIGRNDPSVTYQGGDTIGALSGVVSHLQSGFDFVFPGLSIDLPGTYELVASLYLDGELLMQATTPFVLADLPTFSLYTDVEVNTITTLNLLGSRPQTSPVYLKMSGDVGCSSSASDTAVWPVENSLFITQRNVSFVPFSSGPTKYLCIGVPSQTSFVPLLLHYDPAFSEAYPLTYSFPIIGVATCRTLTASDEYLYRFAGWSTATEGRSYGCKLEPPVSGTIAPCECYFIEACTEFRDPSFTPPNLDIGMCTCCKGWVLVIAALATAAFFATLLYVVYVYV